MTVTNHPASLRMTRDSRNGGKLLTCALCVLLALPGVAAAKKPPKSSSSSTTTTTTSTSTDSGCAVLLPPYIETATNFTVKVVKVPSYPGTWVSPTFYINVDFPTTDGTALTADATQTINRFDVSYGLISIGVPDKTSNIAYDTMPDGSLPTATVTAMVAEPLSNGKTTLSTCSATTPVLPGIN